MKRKLSIIVSVILILSLILSACGIKKDGPSSTVKTAIESFKTEMVDIPEDTFDGLSEFPMLGELIEALMKKMQDFDYKIAGEKLSDDGTRAVVAVKITTYPFGEVFTESVEEIFAQVFLSAFSGDSDGLSKAIGSFIQKMISLQDKTYSKDVTLKLVKKDDVWRVEKLKDNEEFMDAVFGGLQTAGSELESFGEGLSDIFAPFDEEND